MYYPGKQKFMELAEKGNVIPVYREILADFSTPLSAFLKIDKGEFSYLLESAEGGEHMGRYSFLGSDPSLILESRGKVVSVKRGDEVETYTVREDPISEIKSIMDKFRFVKVDGLPRFCGGLVGYIGYDMVRFIENIPDENVEDFDIPDMQLVLTDTILIFDHVDHKIKVVSNAMISGDAGEAYDTACGKIDRIIGRLKTGAPRSEKIEARPAPAKAESNFSEEEFCGIVDRAKEYIRAGEVIQIVLSQRLKRRTGMDAFSIYRALRSINPSPYMYYLQFGEYRIVGSSPEILVRCDEELVEVRPIAGTRKRGEDEEEDLRMEKELLADPKERAEHIMLVDLGRNDIGRVCDYATVKAREIMRIEKYSHVMHIVSDVVGRLRKDKDIYDLMRATFPAGTVTGAPKVRAMELIDELENIRRGPYAGCVGYISFSGNIDMCITIRTIVMSGDTAYIQAGAGIVLDSEPAREYQETMNKAMAMIKAIEFAERGLE
ncbi:MAG: anthranilate synthase component I [Candidatus Makaraimicrobium thalassicum]|nr:MAG: anthranilate synthase component I [Candidatus Omnitrophota bacterium]